MATRRTHPLEFKRSAVEASNQAGASIAGVAMPHGINANQLHKWRRQLRGSESIVAESRILPVTLIHDTEPGSTRQATSEGIAADADIQ